MIRRLVVVVAFVMAIVTLVGLAPRRAAAIDDLAYIIPAAVGGVVIIVLVIAILVVDKEDDSEFDLREVSQMPENPAPGGVRIAPYCRTSAGDFALICW